MNSNKIVVALDYSSAQQALAFVDSVTPDLCRLKVGKELFTSAGPELVRELVARNFDVFLDLKFHDIPNTVEKAVESACELGIWMVNVHALGGRAMMQAARRAVDRRADEHRPLLIAVSILTSMDESALAEIGLSKSVSDSVVDLTRLALDSGVDGMVCSALEAGMLRDRFGQQPVLVTPGIRPQGSGSDDQRRIMTPAEAVEAGSSFLVIGRPITQHAEPARELARINQELAKA